MVYGLNITPMHNHVPKVQHLDGFDGDIPALNPINDGGVGWSGRTGGVPVDGSHFPKRMKWKERSGILIPDFDKYPEPNVSEKAKAAIESLEPQSHQFFPVEYLDRNGNHLENRYWLVVGNRIDSVDRNHTNLVLSDTGAWIQARVLAILGKELPSHIDPTAKPKLVMSLAAIGTLHLWKDKHLSGGGMFISDKMAQVFKSLGLTGLKLDAAKVETV